MPRDNQRQRVYNSEAVVSHKEWMLPVDARRLVRELCRAIGVEVPKVKLRRGGTHSFYRSWPYPGAMHLLPFQRAGGKKHVMKKTVLHELAHHIADQHHGRDKEAHGPEFARICASLYVLCGLDPSGAIFREFEAQQVRFA